jgi:tRNA nucleotidyltransferase (CCA-adding enzyme)
VILKRKEVILKQVLEAIRPSADTRANVDSLAREATAEISSILAGLVPGCTVEVEGSVAKGTYLESRHDLDVFAFFPPDTPRETLEETVLTLGKSWAKTRGAGYEIAYAEHPYVKVFLTHEGADFAVDVVGAYLIDSTADLISAVDRTRFHTEYVKTRMTPGLRDQILLTKQFTRGTGVYGSEVRTGGFSGLLCEVLTLSHGTFLDLLGAAKDWQPGQVVNMEHVGLPVKDFKAPLIVIDPTDANRNAGAAVSLSKMGIFIQAARSFLEDPSERFFFPQARRPFTKSRLKKIRRERGTRLLVVTFQKPNVIDDILYPQIDRMVKSLRGQIEEFGFSLLGPETGGVCEEGGRIHLLLELGVSSPRWTGSAMCRGSSRSTPRETPILRETGGASRPPGAFPGPRT